MFLLCGLVVGLTEEEVEARITALHPADQALLIGGILSALALATVVFGHSGPGGIVAFWAAIAFVLR
ncbi:hypothetical protein [Aliiruegeria haliotis]|uniref:hypothetical protein n=1 Tax=Aliiruegeria haliotis TaxID=1280846 RepID=UPI0011B2292D|nr:hypothetical protein [Aliiruegeria haliotis]